MDIKKSQGSFILGILGVIIGLALFKQFDFDHLRFKKLGLAIVYLISFSIIIFIIIKNRQKKKE